MSVRASRLPEVQGLEAPASTPLDTFGCRGCEPDRLATRRDHLGERANAATPTLDPNAYSDRFRVEPSPGAAAQGTAPGGGSERLSPHSGATSRDHGSSRYSVGEWSATSRHLGDPGQPTSSNRRSIFTTTDTTTQCFTRRGDSVGECAGSGRYERADRPATSWYGIGIGASAAGSTPSLSWSGVLDGERAGSTGHVGAGCLATLGIGFCLCSRPSHPTPGIASGGFGRRVGARPDHRHDGDDGRHWQVRQRPVAGLCHATHARRVWRQSHAVRLLERAATPRLHERSQQRRIHIGARIDG